MKGKNHLGSLPEWKKKILFFIAAIVLLRIGYIFFRCEIDKEYVTSESYDITEDMVNELPCNELTQIFTADRERLYRLEICFAGIPENQTGVTTLKLLHEDKLIYQTNITLTDEDICTWKRIFVNVALKAGDQYRIELDTAESSECVPTILSVTQRVAPEVHASYKDHRILEGDLAINYGYMEEPNLLDKVVASFLWVMLFLCAAMIVVHVEGIGKLLRNIKDHITKDTGETAFTCAFEVLSAAVIICCSGIEFQPLTKILLYTLSLLTGINIAEKRQCIRKILDTKQKKAGFVVLCLYAAFALVGQRVFVYPLDRRVTLEESFVFLSAVCWFIPALMSVFFHLESYITRIPTRGRAFKNWQLFVILLIILLLPAALNLIANNPGISDVDTYESFEKYAQNLYGMYNWHPAFYSIILHKIQRIWNSTYAVILVQYFFWAYVLMELLFFLRKKGMQDALLIFFAMLFGLNAANVLFLNTIWKDIPYTCSIVWLLLIVAKLALDTDEYKKKWYIYLELFVALVFVSLLRKNGIVPLVVTVAALLIICRKNIKLIATVLAAILFMFYVKGPVYAHYQVIEPGRRGIYIGLGQDILGAYYAGGEVAEQTSEMIVVMTKQNTAEYEYNPTWAHQSYDLDVVPADFIMSYVDTFLKNPVLVLRAVLDREDCLWDIFEGQDAVVQNKNFTDTEDGDRRWNEFYSKRVFRSIAPIMSAATAHTVEAQWLDSVTWRCGLLSLFGVIMLAYMLLCHGIKRYLMIVFPVIGQMLSLLLSTGWTDFRYFWPINLLNLSMTPLLMIAAKQYHQKQIGESSSS